MILAIIENTSIGSWIKQGDAGIFQDLPDSEWYTGETFYVSNEHLALEKFWKAQILSVESAQWRMDTTYGGYIRMRAGGLKIANDFFTDNPGMWPPPDFMSIKLYYTATNYAAADLIYKGGLHPAGIRPDGVDYDFVTYKYQHEVLWTAIDYDGNEVPLPRAFGQVQNVPAVRLPDVGDYPTYHMGHIGSNTLPFEVTAVASHADGIKITTGTAHGLSPADDIHLEGCFGLYDPGTGYEFYDYSGTYQVVTVVDTTNFTVATAYKADPAQGALFLDDDYDETFRVTDDGVPIDSNVTLNGDGTFSLAYQPVGTVAISGTGKYGTADAFGLDDILEWAAIARFGLIYDGTYAGAAPNIHKWVTSNKLLMEWLSTLCAVNGYTFYVDENAVGLDTLYLVKMDEDNGSRSLTEHRVFDAEYEYNAPLAQTKTTWTKRTPVEDNQGKYVKEEDQEVTKLSAYPYGDEQDIECFRELPDAHEDIRTILENLMARHHQVVVAVTMPLVDTPPKPGEKITLADKTTYPAVLAAVFSARNMTMNFDRNEITFEGEGTLS